MTLKNFIIVSAMIAFVACSGSSSGGGGGDTLTTTAPIVGADNPDQPQGTDPVQDDPAQDDPKPMPPVYSFDGDYEGDCAVKAFGIASSSCDIVVNIYHDTEAKTLGFVGQVDVNMTFVSTSMPIYSAPLDIVDGNLIDSSGSDIGDIDQNGFYIKEANGDWLRFKKETNGSTSFEGIYTDPTYGQVDINGSLNTVQK
ncbi:MAG: hypothetical protein CME64_00055 [Halobacteriovoraceae bacterium]|nr:hypothetical protein [Halobacteriovoraceae bacterium]|tara:strand:- start:9498 stop:10091 length:594 start_codon:yes stop_codon:yes gene_type:complete